MNPNAAWSAVDPTLEKPAPDAPLVLVVEDEPLVRNVIGRELQRRGYRTLLAADGQAGLDLYARHAHEIGLVVLDWHLPGRSGRATLAEFYARKPGLRVVLVTGDHNADLDRNAREYVACLLFKPFSAHDLMLAVNAVVAA
jgi:two-component system cell cycle sensor histidine kinase/response regulator CckA